MITSRLRVPRIVFARLLPTSKDSIFGGAGKDLLLGGNGKDKLAGGPGKDRQKQ